jgi:hypothetical protein
MGNGSHAHILDVGMINLKFTSGKTVLLKNVQHVPSIKKTLLVVLCCVAMATRSSLSPINMLCQDMILLLVKAMITEVCSAYPCLMYVIRL